MPQPQSTAFFVLLMVIFAGLICWLVLTKHLVLKVLAACLAFIPAVVFGIAAVNKYYDYYQNWNSAIADFTNQGGQAPGVSGSHVTTVSGITKLLGQQVYSQVAAQDGFTLKLAIYGRASHLTRSVYIYLPPQYFQPGYETYKFPVIELIHGFPGQPQDWITVLGVTSILRGLINNKHAQPAVLVMPDANGGRGVSLQCLNQARGPQDATYLAVDLPNVIASTLRVWATGSTWAIAGYSEGGYCAANLGLQYGWRFGFAGVLSGYFQPLRNKLNNPPRRVDPFGGNQALRIKNTPTAELVRLPPGATIPQFWIGAGAAVLGDVRDAKIFRQLVQVRQPVAELKLVPGGGHTMFTWRSLVPQMLEWMTPRLAINAQAAQIRAERQAHQLPPTIFGKHPPPGPTKPPKQPQPSPSAHPTSTKPSPRPSH